MNAATEKTYVDDAQVKVARRVVDVGILAVRLEARMDDECRKAEKKRAVQSKRLISVDVEDRRMQVLTKCLKGGAQSHHVRGGRRRSFQRQEGSEGAGASQGPSEHTLSVKKRGVSGDQKGGNTKD
jgi:hypothetical protein